jgi:NAD+-dependent secondary alcohol dehydrogenase Adh1
MRAALLSEYGQPLELVDRPVPELTRPDEVLVKVGGAGVCATDLHAMEGLMEPAGVSPPVVLGHENAGWVEEAGDLVSTVEVGDAVIVYPPYSCGLCVPCRRGNDMHCDRHEFTGLSVDGGFADYVRVAERSLIKLPAGMEPSEIAPHADAGITAYHAVRRIKHLALPGTTAAVIGVGGVGHIAVQLLRELGSSAVVAIETDERRRELAREVGADDVLEGGGDVAASVRELTDGRGVELVLDFVGTDQTHADAMEMLARGGTYSVVGYGGTLSLPSAALVGSEQAVSANLVGSWTDLWELLQLHARAKLTLRTETHPLTAINEVLDKLRAGEVTGRAVLVPGEG